MSAECFHVGSYIEEAMDARGWDIEDVAIRMGPEEDFGVNYLVVELLIGVQMEGALVGQETAEGLARAFGTSVDVWLNLDASWQRCMALRRN